MPVGIPLPCMYEVSAPWYGDDPGSVRPKAYLAAVLPRNVLSGICPGYTPLICMDCWIWSCVFANGAGTPFHDCRNGACEMENAGSENRAAGIESSAIHATLTL